MKGLLHVCTAAGWIGLVSSLACGVAVPVLAPAQPLAPGKAEVALGVAATRNQSRFYRALSDEPPSDGSASTPQSAPRVSLRQIVDAAQSRAVAPFIAPRLGLPLNNEVWLFGGGGSTGAGFRHASKGRNLALSVGLEAAWLRLRAPASTAMPDPASASESRPTFNGWSAEVPLVFGYRSDTDLMSGWLVARGRLASVTALHTAATQAGDRSLGFGAGASIGVHPVWVRVELLADYHWLELRAETGPTRHVRGLLWTPAAALVWRF